MVKQLKIMNCYCGTELTFNQCCLPIISGTSYAKTPEQLMRSRYSAYASKDAHYIYRTYAEKTRKQQSEIEIKQWAEQTQWLRLNVLDSEQINLEQFTFSKETNLPTVNFSVLYVHDSTLYLMTEISRFTKENEQWHYLDGQILEHKSLKMPKRNERCPCNSGNKFKHCCAASF